LPVLTALGPNLPARVTASLLTSLGLPELIAASPEDYRRRALELARDRPRLGELRRHLAKARLESALYDTGGLARQLERLYRAIWRRHCRGEAPAAMALEPGALEPGALEPGALEPGA
jgi:protein O-GlcNAc transferase